MRYCFTGSSSRLTRAFKYIPTRHCHQSSPYPGHVGEAAVESDAGRIKTQVVFQVDENRQARETQETLNEVHCVAWGKRMMVNGKKMRR